MKDTYTRNEVVELFKLYRSEKVVTCGSFEESCMHDFLKEKGLLNTLEVGKWYISETNKDMRVFLTGFEDNHYTYYGFNVYGLWTDDCLLNRSDGWRLMTNEEVKKALIAEAEKRWYKKGVGVGLGLLLVGGEFEYDHNENTLLMDGIGIFNKGKWAEIISEIVEHEVEAIPVTAVMDEKANTITITPEVNGKALEVKINWKEIKY